MAEADKVFLFADDLQLAEASGRSLRADAVENFARAARVVEDRDQLRQAFVEASHLLGFDHFALQGEGARLLIADLSPNWIFRPDPQRDIVFSAAAHSLSPFLWTDIARLTSLGATDLAQVEAAPPGLVVPIWRPHVLGTELSQGLTATSGFAGCCSFMMRKGGELPVESFAAAHYIGTLALEAAIELERGHPPRPRLTPRQRDCMVLAAQGKSDWEIGKLLGISESTVHKHIEDAKRRFGVSTRIQLVVRGLAEARLSFSDILG